MLLLTACQYFLPNSCKHCDRRLLLGVFKDVYLTDKMKRSFFQAAVASILLYGCTTWTLTKRLEKKLDGNYTTMLRAILNNSWRQHPRRHRLYGHLPPITCKSRTNQYEHTFSSYKRIRNVVLKTCLGRWTIERSGERGSGISVLPARHDEDDDL